ncbi:MULTISPECIES: hypothetical protein [Streptomyces]|uniref:hypothetical protein n=1 Tax=Streptomyces arenae TaxID=29301 RepID=UPI0010566010|nr:hypothetical protein [Streptomyces arenae]MCG7210481.1 hypothetical protein [Streptomyces arenae]
MRIRATVAAVSGALALSALAVPAAQASGGSSYSPADLAKVAAAAQQAASGRAAYTASTADDTGEPYTLDLSFSNVKVNKGKPIVAGTTTHVKAPVTYTVTHAADVDIHADDFLMDVEIYRGSYSDPVNILAGDDWPSCTDTSATTASCKGTIDVYANEDLSNADATSWKAIGYAIALNGQDPLAEDVDWTKIGYVDQDALATTRLQRLSKLTVNAAPEPVKKGKTITVTGKLSRANWDDGKYHGYANQSVRLQFRKKNSSTYTNVKGIKSSSTGTLKTTTKATVDGYYRFSFVGTATTPAVNATGDYVDVK